MSRKTGRIEQILDVALDILKTQGDFGLTMRKVAKLSEISLGSLQYYFKTKDDMLKAMVDRFFKQCTSMLNEIPPLTNEEDLDSLLRLFLSDGDETSDMSCIIREYWAISTRNEVIRNYLDEYYESFSLIMLEKLRPLSVNEKALSQAVSILIPFIEGYSVVGLALPENLDSTNKLLKTWIWKCLKENL